MARDLGNWLHQSLLTEEEMEAVNPETGLTEVQGIPKEKLDEIEALQDQVLSELDDLNNRIETVLKVHLATEASEIVAVAADSLTAEEDKQPAGHD